MFRGEKPDVVHVVAQRLTNGMKVPVTKRFSVDPKVTDLNTLRHLLGVAFNIKGSVVISYLNRDIANGERSHFSPMLSEWDFNAALTTASHPNLAIKVDDIRECAEYPPDMAEWDILDFHDVQQSQDRERSSAAAHVRQLGDLSTFVSKKLREVSQSLASASLSSPADERSPFLRGSVSDAEFTRFLDREGRLVKERMFRLSCYAGGIEPSLRPVAWKHLLNIYPEMLTGEQRIAYLRGLCTTYTELKTAWLERLASGYATEDFRLVCSMVRKDVLRTDRGLPFYSKLPQDSNPEAENSNLRGLFNILTTYALTHPNVSYCQGMSDLASPFLFVMKDEREAYVCFCAFMRRLERNFAPNGLAMTKKFEHLRQLVQFYDPVLFDHLRACHAVDLLFCYRWLLLELKREFEFQDALSMLEVMWSSLPPEHIGDANELRLFDVDIRSTGSGSLCNFPSLTIPGRMGRRCSLGSGDSQHSSQIEALEHLNKCDSCLSIAKLTARELMRPLNDDVCGSGTTSRSISTTDGRLNWLPSADSPKTSCGGTSSSSQGIKSRTSTSSGPTPCENTCAASCCLSSAGHSGSETSSGCPPDEKKRENDAQEALNSRDSTPRSEKDLKSHFRGNEVVLLSETSAKQRSEAFFGRLNDHVSPISSSLMLTSRSSSLTDVSLRHLATGKAPYSVLPKNSNDQTTFHFALKRKSFSTDMLQNPGRKARFSRSPTSAPLVRSTRSRKKSIPENLEIETVNSLSNCSIVENGHPHFSPKIEEKELPFTQSVEKVDKSLEIVNVVPSAEWLLPPPQELGDGNPFCMFLCLTLLLEHSNAILKDSMDYNEIAIHFDKLVRKHDVKKMLRRARILYADYVKSDWMHS